jgi:hypothetical protein
VPSLLLKRHMFLDSCQSHLLLLPDVKSSIVCESRNFFIGSFLVSVRMPSPCPLLDSNRPCVVSPL